MAPDSDPPPPTTEEGLRAAGIDLGSLEPDDRELLLSLTPRQAALLAAILAERRAPGSISG